MKIHENKYDYSSIKYNGLNSDVDIICPIHGSFTQRAKFHLVNGCPRCAGNQLMNTKEWIDSLPQYQKDRFDHSKVKYVKSSEKVIIICPLHGEFLQKASNHKNGAGCLSCVGRPPVKHEDWLKSLPTEHLEKYDYSKSNYNHYNKDVSIGCPHHGHFLQSGSRHKNGAGCPWCAREKTNYDIYKNNKTLLYYVFFPTVNLWKIGITKSSVEERFRYDIPYEEISVTHYDDGWKAFLLEQKILRTFDNMRYSGESVLGAGNTECFSKDILKEFYE